jgi:hypothetical protein
MNETLITIKTVNRCKSYLMTIPNTALGNALFKAISKEYRKEGKKITRLARGKRKAAFIKQAAIVGTWENKRYGHNINANGEWTSIGKPWNYTYRPKLKDRENCTRFDVYFR